MTAPAQRMTVVQIATLALLAGIAVPAKAEFMFIAESAVFNPTTQEVVFTIEFNQVPDFSTVDAFGRQANSFQYYIIGNPRLPYPTNFDAIIRGEEIHLTRDRIRIRNAIPSDPDPAAGGWGAVRGVVPFSLQGKVLTFSAPLPVISDHSTNGSFAYRLESGQFGGTARYIENRVPPVAIDIRPGITPNRINISRNDHLPVAILGASTFDAAQVKPDTVQFGPAQARDIPWRRQLKDVNGDGHLDLVLRFWVQDTGIRCGTTEAVLTGRTFAGEGFTSSDRLRTVGCQTVTLDIRPGTPSNRLDPQSTGNVPVAVLTTPTFDATQVDPRQVRFGPRGAQDIDRKGQVTDVDGDGDADLVFHFRVQHTGIQCGDTQATLTGATFTGQAIIGTDRLRTIGCP